MFIESICRSRQVPKAHLALIHGTQDVKIQINAECAKSRNQRYESWRMPYAHSSLVIHRV